MSLRFDNGDLITFEHPEHGKGKGVVVGYFNHDGQEFWVVYPKVKRMVAGRLFSSIVVHDSQVVATPF